MHKLLLPAFAVLMGFGFAGCVDESSDMPKLHQLEDSVFKYYPNTQSLRVHPEDKENLIVVVGDRSLFPASDDQKQKEATNIGRIALTIFGKDSYLRKGRLVVTTDIHNATDEPSDGIVVKINIDSLKTALFK